MNYILYGNDESRMHQKITTILRKHQIDHVSDTFDATKDEQRIVNNAIDSRSIFDDKRLIVVKNATFFTGKDTTKYDVDEILKRTNQDEDVIIVYICLVEKLSPRKKVAKQVLSYSNLVACLALDQRSQRDYIQDGLRTRNIRMDRDAFQWVSARIGLDALHIDSELDKLQIYNSHITLEDVKALIAPEPLNDVFKMVKALFDQNALLLLSYYRNFRALNMEPIAIIGLLAGQIRFLLEVRICMDQGKEQNEIASELQAHPYRVKVNMQNAQDFTSQELLDQLEELSDLDYQIKSGQVDKDQGFEQFIMNQL